MVPVTFVADNDVYAACSARSLNAFLRDMPWKSIVTGLLKISGSVETWYRFRISVRCFCSSSCCFCRDSMFRRRVSFSFPDLFLSHDAEGLRTSLAALFNCLPACLVAHLVPPATSIGWEMRRNAEGGKSIISTPFCFSTGTGPHLSIG